MENSFNSLNDAKFIKQAISEPKDMNKLINIIAHRSNEQRQEIFKTYSEHYNISIMEDFKLELKGPFRKTAVALFYTPVDYDCYHLNKAFKGLTNDEDTIIEILSTRSNNRIKEIKNRFPQMYEGKSLDKVINSETSGFFCKILLKLLEGERSNNTQPIKEDCQDCAKQLKEAEKNEKIREEVYLKIFTEKSREEFELITRCYYNLYNKTLLETIEDLFSRYVKKIFKSLFYSLLNLGEYFAYRINEALNSFMLNDKVLIRVVVTQDIVDIKTIKQNYKQKFKKDLYKMIQEKIKGDYRNILVALIGK